MRDHKDFGGQNMSTSNYGNASLGQLSSLNVVQPPPTVAERLEALNARLLCVEKELVGVLDRLRGAVPEDAGCSNPDPQVLSVLDRLNKQDQRVLSIETLASHINRLI